MLALRASKFSFMWESIWIGTGAGALAKLNQLLIAHLNTVFHGEQRAQVYKICGKTINFL